MRLGIYSVQYIRDGKDSLHRLPMIRHRIHVRPGGARHHGKLKGMKNVKAVADDLIGSESLAPACWGAARPRALGPRGWDWPYVKRCSAVRMCRPRWHTGFPGPQCCYNAKKLVSRFFRFVFRPQLTLEVCLSPVEL